MTAGPLRPDHGNQRRLHGCPSASRHSLAQRGLATPHARPRDAAPLDNAGGPRAATRPHGADCRSRLRPGGGVGLPHAAISTTALHAASAGCVPVACAQRRSLTAATAPATRHPAASRDDRAVARPRALGRRCARLRVALRLMLLGPCGTAPMAGPHAAHKPGDDGGRAPARRRRHFRPAAEQIFLHEETVRGDWMDKVVRFAVNAIIVQMDYLYIFQIYVLTLRF